jgi:hypothetical protein
MNRPASSSSNSLLPDEKRFVNAMQKLAFGRYEFLRIDSGQLVLEPWPATIQGVKFGSHDAASITVPKGEFLLKPQVIELFEYVRAVDAGEIRRLEVRHGLPFSMEIEHKADVNGGSND